MNASKAGIATSGHNITNANTEGFSRERVTQTADASEQKAAQGGPYIGRGAKLSKIERINDSYVEKHLREGTRDLAHYEEKKMVFGQIEDVFNEMNGDGLNRLVSRFFNEFRKLSNEPNSHAIRESVREASKAIVNDFQRIRKELVELQKHVDSRIEGGMKELNQLSEEMGELNLKIHRSEIQGHSPNDLLDRRDVVAKKMMTYFDLSTHKDEFGMMTLDVKGVGPLVTGPRSEQYFIGRTPANAESGKPENSLSIMRSPYSHDDISNQFKGGKLGALIEARDKSIGSIMDRLDQMAHAVSTAVNEIHQQGFTATGRQGVAFFKPINQVERAAEMISLSDDLNESANNIATAMAPNSPGDNRLAHALANLQNSRFFMDGTTTMDDFYNSMVSDVGVSAARNNEALSQQKTITNQLEKMRETISGVSIDEETTKLLQYQHAFNASARVIRVADEMLDTILNLGRG